MVKRALILTFVLILTAGFLSTFSSKPPKVLSKWTRHNPANTADVDHRAWDQLLKKYVRKNPQGINLFAYGKVTAGNKKALKDYLASLARVNITGWSREVQLAYWINLYNALTIQVILDHYPVKSIRDIDISGAFSDGPWGKKLITVEGSPLSLDDIEHRILRPIWKDPRIHYAVNCASIGCPNLQSTAYLAAGINRRLDRAAKEFINHPRGVHIKNNKVTVSKIYSWFAYDFGNSEAGVIKHLSRYLSNKKAAALKRAGRITKTQYDWSLNE